MKNALKKKTRARDSEARGNVELEWLSRHREILEQHEGQWIAISGECMVAAAEKLSAVRKKARLAGANDPLIFFVPLSLDEYWIGLSNQPLS